MLLQPLGGRTHPVGAGTMEAHGGIVPTSWGGEMGPLGAVGTGPIGSSVLASDGSVPAGLCSEACLLRRSHCDSPLLLRAGSAGKSKLLPSKKVTQQLSKTTTRSLGDLKVCRSTRGLVARFLQRPKRSPAAGVEVPGHSSQGHKQVSSGSRGVPGDREPHPRPLPPSSLRQHLHAGPSGVSVLLPCAPRCWHPSCGQGLQAEPPSAALSLGVLLGGQPLPLGPPLWLRVGKSCVLQQLWLCP